MKFKKYVAAGNDFIAFKEEDIEGENYNFLAEKVCHRRFGIGGDGIIISCESSFADIKMLYYNSDGSQGEMCGNGIRAFTKFVYDNDIVRKDKMTIETLDGVKQIKLLIEDNRIASIEVGMGKASFNNREIPINIDRDMVLNESLELEGKKYIFSALRVGVPHVVIYLDEVDTSRINKVGRLIENHKLFPKKTNVNFVEKIRDDYIRVYTWERGAGRTLGCGTGSCSAVVVGNKLGILREKVNVKTEGGMLQVVLNGEEIIMRGNASLIAEGSYIYK